MKRRRIIILAGLALVGGAFAAWRWCVASPFWRTVSAHFAEFEQRYPERYAPKYQWH